MVSTLRLPATNLITAIFYFFLKIPGHQAGGINSSSDFPVLLVEGYSRNISKVEIKIFPLHWHRDKSSDWRDKKSPGGDLGSLYIHTCLIDTVDTTESVRLGSATALPNHRSNHVLQPRPLGLSLYPAVSGGRDILLGDRFRTKLAYTPPLLTTSVELGCKKT